MRWSWPSKTVDNVDHDSEKDVELITGDSEYDDVEDEKNHNADEVELNGESAKDDSEDEFND